MSAGENAGENAGAGAMSDKLDDTPLTFGKYKGKTPDEVGDLDPQYIVWMYENVKPTPCSRALAESCEMDCRDMYESYADFYGGFFYKD